MKHKDYLLLVFVVVLSLMNLGLAKFLTLSLTFLAAVGALAFNWGFWGAWDLGHLGNVAIVIVTAIETALIYRALTFVIPVKCPQCSESMKYIPVVPSSGPKFKSLYGYKCGGCGFEDYKEHLPD